jgi:hypothetical protein
MANALIQNPVDRENHIVHGVKVLGFTSANGRIYDFAAVKEAIQKYEKAPVNKDHNMEEPSFSDRLGWLENVTLEKDGLYADFHYNPHAEGIESFLWFAEHNGLGDVGFSHLVSGKYSVDPDGTERITRIDKVKSVDLVANPATTKTIFESEKLDQGNNETLSRGIEKNNDGTYTALTYSNSKTFKTLAGAKKWMNERPRPMKEAENVYLDYNKFKDQHLKMYPKASEADCKKAFEKYKSIHAEQEVKPMGKKIAKEAGNAANKAKKNAIDDRIGQDFIRKNGQPKHPLNYQDTKTGDVNSKYIGRQVRTQTDPGVHWDKLNKVARGEQEDDDVGEADSDEREFEMAVDSLDRLLMKDKISQKDYDKKYDELSKKMKDKKRYPVKPEQEGDDEMDKEKLMEEENPMIENSYEDDYYPGENPNDHDVMFRNQKLLMQQRAAKKKEEELKKNKGKKIAKEAEQDPMMEEADDVYAKVKEVCEGEGSDEEKSKMVLEMLGLSGGMSEGEDEPMEEAEEDPEEKDGSKSDVLEVDDEEEEEPKKESKSELASLRKWKAEKLKEEKIVNLIKESNLEPTKVFIKQLSAIDSKLWSEAINDRKKVALVKSSVKPISSGLQSRSESSYKQFLESVLGK